MIFAKRIAYSFGSPMSTIRLADQGFIMFDILLSRPLWSCPNWWIEFLEPDVNCTNFANAAVTENRGVYNETSSLATGWRLHE